jgi:CHAD domain-containing protein
MALELKAQNESVISFSSFISELLVESACNIQLNSNRVLSHFQPEDLHQFRVSLRKLRSYLSTLKSGLDRTWVDYYRTELHWLDGLATTVRDNDVLIDRLTIAGEKLANRLDLGAFEEFLRKIKISANSSVVQFDLGMKSRRALELFLAMALWEESGVPAEDSEGDVKNCLRKINKRMWTEFTALANEINPQASDQELHEVRKFAKQVRYFAEISAPILGHFAQEHAKDAKRIQAILGAHHDSHVMSHWLIGELGGNLRIDSTSYELLAYESTQRYLLRNKWEKEWRKINS